MTKNDHSPDVDSKIDEILAEDKSDKDAPSATEVDDAPVYSIDEAVSIDKNIDDGLVDDDSSGIEPSDDSVSNDADEEENNYFEDDQEWLSSDDLTVHEDINMAIVKQSDTVVSWQVDNFYKENGEPRSARSLKNDPPIFTVGDSRGESVSFVVTKEFARQLESVMGDIYRGYFNVSSKRAKELNQKGVKGSFEKFKQWASENKGKAIVFGFAAVTVLVLAVIL